MRRIPLSRKVLIFLIAIGVVVWAITQANPVAVAVAVFAGWAMMRIGFGVLSALGTPVPPPPPPGELRKVRLTYRCGICGTEVRMTSANDEVPEPPRHCQDDMELVAPIYE